MNKSNFNRPIKFSPKFCALALSLFFLAPANISAAAQTYTVQKGDSLWKIAQKYHVGISEIISANDQFKNPNMIYPGQKVTIPVLDSTTTSFEQTVINLVNQERDKRGLPALKENWEVSRVARYKSKDMCDKNYFSHTSPTYGSPFDMLKQFNINYRTAGENIAKGQNTAAKVVESWMNSEGHRANILNKDFTQIGVGYYRNNGVTYWTQMFIKP